MHWGVRKGKDDFPRKTKPYNQVVGEQTPEKEKMKYLHYSTHLNC